jgi:hypothetical protein
MKAFCTISLFFLCFLLTGCTLPPKVHSNYDTNFDFSGLEHYNWFELPGDIEADEIIVQRLKDAVDKQMENKGFTRRLEDPDFLISMQGFKSSETLGAARGTSYQRGTASGTRRGTSRESMRGREFSKASYSTTEYTAGNLTLTIIDAATDQPIWEGLITGLIRENVSTEAREKRIHETFAKLLADFPPGN